MNTPHPMHPSSNQGSITPAGTQRRNILHYDSKTLFNGRDQLWIEHNGERYSLRVTRQGKLILTK